MLEGRVIETREDYMNLIKEETFSNEVIVEIDLTSIDFESVIFEKCRFINCDFTKSNFREVVFSNCDVSNCQFVDTYWNNSAIVNSKGDGSSLKNSHLKFLKINSCSMNYVIAAETIWDSCEIEEVQMQSAFFSEAKLKKTTFTDVNLQNADFYKTPLKGVDLSTCNIESILLTEGLPELKGAKINMFQATSIVQMLGIKVI